MTAPVLATRGLDVRYGGVHALKAVDLEVGEGKLVGLIGPNGAGKTTFIDAVTGFARATGTATVDGTDVSGLAPHVRARHGLARTWQSAELFDQLSVAENLSVAVGGRGWRELAGEVWRGRADTPDVVGETLELLGLEAVADVAVDELTQGQRKLVGVARALAARPRVVLLDEPAAGLNTTESLALGRELRAVVERGTAMLLVDHDMGLVLSICDHVVVLEFGTVIAAGPADEVRRDPRVVEAYLGAAA
jgi:branched-chain amino acid transport system ATP-binding protein